MDDDQLTPHDEQLTGAPATVARLLRDDVPVRAAWRDALLDRIDRDDLAAPRGRWSISPMLAVAAGLLLVVLGAAGERLLGSRTTAVPAIAASAANSGSVVRFVYVAPAAAHVAVVGDFNRW